MNRGLDRIVVMEKSHHYNRPEDGWRRLTAMNMDWIDRKIAELNSPEYRKALGAMKSLEDVTDFRIVDPMLMAMGRKFEDEEPRFNRKAGIILSKMQDVSLEAWLIALNKDAYTCNDDSWRRYWTAYNLQLCENVRVIKPLVDLLQEPDRYVFEGALDSLLALDKKMGIGEEKVKAIECLKQADTIFGKQIGLPRYNDYGISGFIKYALKQWE